MFYKGHRFFSEDVNLVRPYFEDFCRTYSSTLTATIALIRINGNIPVAGPILKSIISYHCFALLSPSPYPSPARGEGIRASGFSCALCLSHLQKGLSEEGCSNASGELCVKGVFTIHIFFLIPGTIPSFNP